MRKTSILRKIAGSMLLPAALAMALSVAACQVKFVADYDEVFDEEITTAQMDTDALLSAIASDPAQPYSSFASDYATVNTDLDALQLRAGIYDNNREEIDMVAILKRSFAEFQQSHASGRTMQAQVAEFELAGLNKEFARLMKLELLKKSGPGAGG
jgi:hypothetical protein